MFDFPEFEFKDVPEGETLPAPWFKSHLAKYGTGKKMYVWAKDITKEPKAIYKRMMEYLYKAEKGLKSLPYEDFGDQVRDLDELLSELEGKEPD